VAVAGRVVLAAVQWLKGARPSRHRRGRIHEPGEVSRAPAEDPGIVAVEGGAAKDYRSTVDDGNLEGRAVEGAVLWIPGNDGVERGDPGRVRRDRYGSLPRTHLTG